MAKENREIKDFVYYMIHKKGLTKAQQAKRDKLFARDSKLIATSPSIIPSTQGDTPVERTINYIPPNNLQEFLYRFNQNSILKYTCHEIDTQETIEEIRNLCKTKLYSVKSHSVIIANAFAQLLNELRKNRIYIDYKMYGLMSVYLTGKTKNGQTKWSSLNIDVNWADKRLHEWGEKNPNIIPSPGKNIARKQKNKGFELPKALRSNLSGKRILTFGELALYFKSLFHIKRDNSLKDILTYTNEKNQYNKHGIDISFSETNFKNNIELLTDVDKLVQAYTNIINICKKSHGDDEQVCIELSFYEGEDHVYFTIHDKNSVYGKTLKAATQRIGEAQTKLIKNQVNGLCNLYIEADFGNQEYARIALWHEGSKPLGQSPNIEVEKKENCQGVKYILIF